MLNSFTISFCTKKGQKIASKICRKKRNRGRVGLTQVHTIFIAVKAVRDEFRKGRGRNWVLNKND